MKGAYLRLKPLREVKVAAPVLLLDVEGEELAKKLVQRFVIDRNGSVSERLWRLVYSPDDPLDDAEAPSSATRAGWARSPSPSGSSCATTSCAASRATNGLKPRKKSRNFTGRREAGSERRRERDSFFLPPRLPASL